MRIALVLTCAAMVLAGCSTSQAGTPRPADPDVAEAPESDPDEDPLDGLGQCDLLTPGDLEQIGLEPGKPRGDQICNYERTRGGGALVALFWEQGAASRGDSGEPVDFGDGDAYLQREPDGGRGGCRIVLPTSDTSYVLIGAVTGLDTDLACELATNIAQHVDSGLS